jgi:phage N-6-adenine-methyltransferase
VNDWYTPPEVLQLARRVMGGIDLDPASDTAAQVEVRATAFFTEDDHALERPWGGRVWMNPPFSMPLVEQFTQKAIAEYQSGRVSQAMVLVNNATETAWCQALLRAARAFCLLEGRVQFWNATQGSEDSHPLQGQVLAYLGADGDTFATACQRVGIVAVPTSSLAAGGPGRTDEGAENTDSQA